MLGHGEYRLLGSTVDDAAGEAFDKVARILGLGYPGGPAIAVAATKDRTPNPKFQIQLPRPMIDSCDFDFSFSGIKTAVLYQVRGLGARRTKRFLPFLAREFQDAVVDVLVTKTIKAAKKYQAKSIMIGGGVAANKFLGKEMRKAVRNYLPYSKFNIPNRNLCTDNAVIVGVCAYYKYLYRKKTLKNWSRVKLDLSSEV
jgi:N6-L-threonylcarbamoyladenine synthase